MFFFFSKYKYCKAVHNNYLVVVCLLVGFICAFLFSMFCWYVDGFSAQSNKQAWHNLRKKSLFCSLCVCMCVCVCVCVCVHACMHVCVHVCARARICLCVCCKWHFKKPWSNLWSIQRQFCFVQLKAMLRLYKNRFNLLEKFVIWSVLIWVEHIICILNYTIPSDDLKTISWALECSLCLQELQTEHLAPPDWCQK